MTKINIRMYKTIKIISKYNKYKYNKFPKYYRYLNKNLLYK